MNNQANRPTEAKLKQMIDDRFKDLHEAIKVFDSESSPGDAIEVLTELTYNWLAESVGFDQYATVDRTKDHPLRSGHFDTLYSAFRLMVFVTKVHESWDGINELRSRLNQEQE